MTVRLAFSVFGEGTPLVILHGLFGAGRNWQTIARALATRWRVYTPDARNHGRSPWAEPMTYGAMVEDLRALLDAEEIQRAVLIGHSMGGKTAMLFALEHELRVEALVVVDIAPVAYGHTFLPYVRAMERLDLTGRPTRAELDARLARDIADSSTRAFLMQNLTARHGLYTWRINLAAIGRHMADLTGFPDVGLRQYDWPVLFLSGEHSDYIRPDHQATIEALFPQARIEVIPGAGHRVHADRPAEFLAHVESFLRDT